MFLGRAEKCHLLNLSAVTIRPHPEPLAIHTGLELTSTTPPPIGRVRLSDIARDWSRTQVLNPHLLATEVAGVLRAIAPDGQPLEGHHYSLAMFDLATGAGELTYWALADYFDALGSEQPNTSVQTTTGPTPAGTVLLAQTFVGRIVIDATQRAATANGFVVELLPGPAISGGAQRQTLQSEQPPGSSPEVLAAHQAKLRQEGEQSAVEQLAAAQADCRRLEAENAKLSARLIAMEAQVRQAQEAAGQDRRQANEDRRARQIAIAKAADSAQAKEIAEAKLAEAEAALEQAKDFADLRGALSRVEKWLKGATPAQQNHEGRPILLVVAGLLELLLDRKRPNYNQGSAAQAIAQKGWRGAGDRQVNGIFAEAKRLARNASSDAIAKAQDIQQSHTSRTD